MVNVSKWFEGFKEWLSSVLSCVDKYKGIVVFLLAFWISSSGYAKELGNNDMQKHFNNSKLTSWSTVVIDGKKYIFGVEEEGQNVYFEDKNGKKFYISTEWNDWSVWDKKDTKTSTSKKMISQDNSNLQETHYPVVEQIFPKLEEKSEKNQQKDVITKEDKAKDGSEISIKPKGKGVEVEKSWDNYRCAASLWQEFSNEETFVSWGCTLLPFDNLWFKLDGRYWDITNKIIATVVWKIFWNPLSITAAKLNTKVWATLFGKDFKEEIWQGLAWMEYKFPSFWIFDYTKFSVSKIVSDGADFGNVYDGTSNYYAWINKADAQSYWMNTRIMLLEWLAFNMWFWEEWIKYKNSHTANEDGYSKYYNAWFIIQPSLSQRAEIRFENHDNQNKLMWRYDYIFDSGFSVGGWVSRVNYMDERVHSIDEARINFWWHFWVGASPKFSPLYASTQDEEKRAEAPLSTWEVDHVEGTNINYVKNLKIYTKKIEDTKKPEDPEKPKPEDPEKPTKPGNVAWFDLAISSDSGARDYVTYENILVFNWTALKNVKWYEISFDWWITWKDIGNVITYKTPVLNDWTYKTQIKWYNDQWKSPNATATPKDIVVSTKVPTKFTFQWTSSLKKDSDYDIVLDFDNKIPGWKIVSVSTLGISTAKIVGIDANWNGLMKIKTSSSNWEELTVVVESKAWKQSQPMKFWWMLHDK
jgi:hypothetical protein